MEVKALLQDKFWILEKEGVQVGTLSWDEERYVFASPKETKFLNSQSEIKEVLGIDLSTGVTISDSPTTELEVHGYPTSVTPYNTMYDVKRQLPLFTKSEKSKSLYCAGYYIIKFDKGWVKSFCPKLITIERYISKGPFKTESSMKEALWNAK
jgi:hypothetical protein